MIDMKRRTFLKGSVAAGAVSAAIGAGLLTPRMVLAAWPTAAFEAKTVDSALDALMGSHQLEGSESISFEMVMIPGGTFLMGSPPEESGRREDEGPQFQVTLAPFYLCTKETTLGLFLAFYGEIPPRICLFF